MIKVEKIIKELKNDTIPYLRRATILNTLFSRTKEKEAQEKLDAENNKKLEQAKIEAEAAKQSTNEEILSH